jgi:putative ABC transport system permease protein
MRSLRRSPGFFFAAVFTLALGIGATTAIFSVVNSVLLRPLPYAEPDAVVRIWNSFGGSPKAAISPAEYFDYHDRATAFSAFGVYATGQAVNLTGADVPERLHASYLSVGVFPALGIRPGLGRAFTAEEDTPSGAHVVVLSDGLWRRRFAASPSIVGQRITLNGESYEVIGVMPPEFRLPEDFGAIAPSELFLPLGIDRASIPNRGSHFLHAVARLRPGVTMALAQQSVRKVAADFVRDFPDDYPADMHFDATVVPLRQDLLGPVRPALLVLFGAVSLLLLTACANVAGLLLSRSDARRQELAVRTALGAGSGRIVRQLLVESLLLGVTGGALGLLLAYWGAHAMVLAQPGDIPRIQGVSLDLRVLLFALGTSVITGLAFGILPALRATRGNAQSMIREGGRGRSAGLASQRGQRALVVAETALTLVLLFGAGLLARSFVKLQSVDPGFRAENILTSRVTLPAREYSTPAQVTRFYGQLMQRLAALPGVTASGAVSSLPLATTLGDLNFHIQGRPEAEGDISPKADWLVVTPGYFEALGMRLVRGRAIETTDDERAPGVVVINQAMAHRYWQGENPIGQRFELGGGAGPGWVTVIGVVDDVRHGGLDSEPSAQMYLPHAQFLRWDSHRAIAGMTVALRTSGDPARLAAAVRREVHALDSNLPVSEVQTMEQVVSASIAQPRFLALLFSGFAVVALVLAAVGLYAVLAYSVSRRSREIGIRMALGAREHDVASLVIRQGLLLALVGIALGLVGNVALHGLVKSLLFGVSAMDPLTLLAVSVLLAAIALLASWLPARRAARVDPIVALRSE